MNSVARHTHAGYSLTEVLTVVAVIGILTAVAVPTVSNVHDSSEEAKDKRNAQNIASICSSAAAAGLDLMDAEGNLATTISNVATGGYVSGGIYNGSFFGLPGLSEAEQTAAMSYLSLVDGRLEYNPTQAVVLELPIAQEDQAEPPPEIAEGQAN